MHTPQIHLVTGKWASGKTHVCSLLAHQLFNQTQVLFASDRIGLEDAAAFDYGYDPETRSTGKQPLFCTVFNSADWAAPGYLGFKMEDGFAMHVVRNEIVENIQIQSQSCEKSLIIEIAIGPDVFCRTGPHGILKQSTQNLIERLACLKLSARAELNFYQINADLETRLDRQGLRHDPTAREAFNLYAGDGGEITENQTSQLQSHGWNVMLLENGQTTTSEKLAAALGLPCLDPEIARTEIYPQLLSPEILIRIPPEKFEGHPFAQNPEGLKPASKER